ncbi:unnamed protein product [Bursaphelenchus xylophilus]|uniref:Elongation of very long chain fatty acids protein n=1 Tax=Bursaphelenchus xylophilus TaxID=6326 RepID=A0A1I7S5Q5_BURXY|nr:unnamed protein product [Bursaphelenchus xylophilus]CAG9124964.1 unnamed protein product [Bursaphelenchus xylophilus]
MSAIIVWIARWIVVEDGVKFIIGLHDEFKKYNPFNANVGKLFANGRFLRKTSSYEHVPIFWFENYFTQEGVHNLACAGCEITLYLTVLYYGFILLLVQYMKDRPPYSLKTALFLWNLGLAIFSVFGAWRIGQEFFARLSTEGFTQTVCLLPNEFTPTTFWMIAFALSKIVEFGDTIFVVLRKRPLIFLHYYHHAAALIYAFHSGAHVSATGVVFALMNYAVHVLMYSYYAISALGIRLPKPLAMTITTLQTVQMFAAVGITIYAYYLKAFTDTFCQVYFSNLHLAFFIYVTFAALFLRFFYGTYVEKKKVKQQ